ncbi:MAG TPA: 1-deoxy-D-xylulose-5-phosphate reductoisomerase [Chloroflexi bacterium]|jgi:1-deoxy-D-xylulose-5-phosphate reductoisomerase|nr:1-deoxy-D-xylulose-5-phosphate reductoisomerase [Chloroflexota bacterium]
MPRNLVILGSTGSVGRQTLDVVRMLGDRIRVIGLAAGSNSRLLQEQAAEFRPVRVALMDERAAAAWNNSWMPAVSGIQGFSSLVEDPDVDVVVVATVGAVGLRPSLSALRAGKLVALANKETLVMAGQLIQDELAAGDGTLVPIDSEHSAVWQCLLGEPRRSIERLILTASGGALRQVPTGDLKSVTPAQALLHPNWLMGPKITIDSATLMNKGLEVLEARWLFDISLDRIDLLLHEQSIVHSMVTFDDSSVKAQLGLPDMRLPIQYALSHPDRWPNQLERLDLGRVGTLTFGQIDLARHPLLTLALEAGRAGGTYPAVLCAADEIAVHAFLTGAVPFTTMPSMIQSVLDAHVNCPEPNVEDILEADGWARRVAAGLVAEASPF